MRCRAYLRLALTILVFSAPMPSLAQSEDSVSLGDLARAVRKAKEPTPQPAAPVVIDNDNLSKIMDDVENHRLNGKPLLSMDSKEKTLRMSSPDGTCSLSFNAEAASLVVPPYVSEELPQSEIAKLDGPAKIDGDRLQVTIFNGTDWNLKEVTIGLTIVRRIEKSAGLVGAPRLLPAVAQDAPSPENSTSSEKPSDLTLVYHLKGTAAPMATTIFRETLSASLAPDQEWHWAILNVKGIPPNSSSPPTSGPEPPSPALH
jgi:hypothetical protein